jgi:hypothetical protein
MEPQGKDVERLLAVLEEVRLLILSGLPAPAARQKKPSWDDVWLRASYGAKPNHRTTAQVTLARSRLSEQFTRALRALRFSSP